MSYAQEDSVEADLQFRSPSGLTVKTTGVTLHVASHDLYVHEVVIVEGLGAGRKFLLNLDYAEPL